MAEVKAELRDYAQAALAHGIAKDHIMLDVGIGFGKKFEQNYPLLAGLDQLQDLGFPLLVGTSRKSFIGRTLAVDGKDAPPDQRLNGSVAAATASVLKGAHVVRSPDFPITDSLRQSLWARVAAKGIKLDRAHFDSVSTVIDRLLGIEIARYALGPDAEFKRRLSGDRVIAAALELSNGAQVENDLLRRAGERRAAKHEDIPHTT